jgi:hypothetical protein
LRYQPRAFTRLQRASYFLLRGQEKSNHCAAGAARTAKLARRAEGRSPESREGHPTHAPYAQSLCSRCASLLRGSLTVHPWTGIELAHIHVGHPSGNSCAASPRATGPFQRASCAPWPKPKRAEIRFAFALSLLRRKRSQWDPYVAAVGRRESPQGGSQGCEPVRCQHTDVLSANLRSRAAKSEGRTTAWMQEVGQRMEQLPSPETAASGVAFS